MYTASWVSATAGQDAPGWGGRCDAELFQAFALPVCQGLPELRRSLPGRLFQALREFLALRGGRPPGFAGERYQRRSTVERAINGLK